MKRCKCSKKRLYKKFYNEERKASKEYKRLHFLSQARDEAKHAKFFKKLGVRKY
jgi:hypothetical protein